MATDKMLHLFVGMVIGQLVTVCTGSFLLGIAAALAAGLIKELWDLLNENGTSDFWDLFATIIGGAIGSAVTSICILYGAVI